MKKFFNPTKAEWPDILKRPTQTVEDIEETVNQVFAEVKSKGDVAVSKYTELFDGINLANTQVTEKEISAAANEVSEELKEAIKLAKSNIENFHTAQKPIGLKLKLPMV